MVNDTSVGTVAEVLELFEYSLAGGQSTVELVRGASNSIRRNTNNKGPAQASR